jgi:hypothetical protein
MMFVACMISANSRRLSSRAAMTATPPCADAV